MHAHHAVQFVISLDRPYPTILGDEPFDLVRGFLIDSDVSHSCRSSDSTVLIVSVEAESSSGKILRNLLKGKNYVLVEEILSPKRLNEFSDNYSSYMRNRSKVFNYLQLLIELGCFQENAAEADPRIAITINFISENINKKFYVAEIAERVNLSEGRLRHLFREKTGTSIKSYILWTRIKIASREMLKNGSSLSQTAHFAGFTDQAHFTRIFRRMFGTSPRLLTKHAQSFQVFD